MKGRYLGLAVLVFSIFIYFGHVSAATDLKPAAIVKFQREVIKALPVETQIIRIAVLDLENDDGTIRDALISVITEKTNFKVIERTDLDKILEEQGLQLKDVMDEKTRIQHGKIKGVQGLLMGKVLGMGKGFMSYNLKVHLKLDDVEKGEIVFSKDITSSVVSPIRSYLVFGVIGIIILLFVVIILRKRRAAVIKKAVKGDISARYDITREIDKAITNIATSRSKLNSKGNATDAIKLNAIESDLLHIKQVIQLAPRGSVLKDDTKDYKDVLEFDQNIRSSFQALTKYSERIYEVATSGSSASIEREIDVMAGVIKNILNEFKDRKF
ncbi:MAG: hypothetical protein FJ123_00775 [Deltaproteobacteria bacterium]|nr:hypothetical protein [Deltaproteobacteria bacterium]